MEAARVVSQTDESRVMSYRVVKAIAAEKNIDPASMTPVLYDAIDPDALDKLLDTDEFIEVEFQYDGHSVVAKSDGTVVVDGSVF